jgi:hypothetical protein
VQELLDKLEQLCLAQGIQKFSAEEIVQLLEDGEEVEWIVSQLGEDSNGELGRLLVQIPAEVAPAAPAEGDGEAVEEVTSPDEEAEDFDLSNLDMDELQGMLPPGVDMGQVQQMLNSPRGELLADFGAFCQKRGVEMETEQGEMNEALQELQQEWLHTPRDTLDGKKPAEVLDGGSLFPTKVETFRREEPKVGRNDPCPCGSGKKYKKCCGKAA